MKIDLFTVHIFLLCLAITFALAWGVLWRSFSHVRGVGWWALSVAALTTGGVIVVRSYIQQGYGHSPLGHFIINIGFNLMWVGTARFHGWPARWLAFWGLSFIGLLGLIAARQNVVLLSLVYSTTAAIPFALSIKVLLHHTSTSLAARLSAGGLTLAIFGELVRALSVAAFFVDTIPATITQPTTLVGIISIAFGWTACMFGFVLALMERERSVLSALVVEDELTGLSSRRHFQDSLRQQCARAHRTGQPFCLLVLDLDGFKTINDAYGHAAGDACLRRFGEIVSARLRRSDVIARMGGDEFSVILPGTKLTDALRVAEDLRQAVRNGTIGWENTKLHLAVSIGVAEWDAFRNQSPEDLTAEADRALYKAKQDGRDCVACLSTVLPLAR